MYKYHEIVMTGGISLLFSKKGNNNYWGNLFGKLTKDKGFFSFKGTNPYPKDDNNAEEEIKAWLKEMRSNFSKIEGQERNISAEYSMIYSLKTNGKLAEKPNIILLHTDTFGGRAAAYLNKEILERDFNAAVELDEVKDIDVIDRIKLNRSLGDYMSLVNKHLYEKQKEYACFAPIGGYKIMSSLGYIVALFNNLPIAYLHEDKQILHEIPPIPVKYDENFIEKNSKFLRKLYIADILEKEELEYHQSKLIEENSHFFEIADDIISINAFGRFICKQNKFRHIFGIRVFISQEVVQLTRKNPSAKSFIQQQILELIKKINSKESDSDLYHEREFKNLRDTTLRYHLYKGASNGIHVFRASWKHDQEKQKLYINHVWLNHNDYEREVSKVKGLEKDFGNFEEISEKVYQILGG